VLHGGDTAPEDSNDHCPAAAAAGSTCGSAQKPQRNATCPWIFRRKSAYDLGLLILRLCLGLTFVVHGYDIFFSTGIVRTGDIFNSIGIKPGVIHA